jgi:hypothetical protein
LDCEWHEREGDSIKATHKCRLLGFTSYVRISAIVILESGHLQAVPLHEIWIPPEEKAKK